MWELLGSLGDAEAADLTEIERLAGTGTVVEAGSPRPFRTPSPGLGVREMVGDGRLVRPGEVSRAHGGVLLLEDLARGEGLGLSQPRGTRRRRVGLERPARNRSMGRNR